MKQIFRLFMLLMCFTVLEQLPTSAQIVPKARLDANNVAAFFSATGAVPFNWDCVTYEVPAGSGKPTIYTHTLWIGGLDDSNQLYVAAERYKQNDGYIFDKSDFWVGPLKTADATTDVFNVIQYYRLWKIERSEIEQFIANAGNSGYTIPEAILTWPAHGRPGYAANLAPFVDVDSDGIYNPQEGDYPDVPGDMCLYFIFNDNFDAHAESQGTPIGLEVHGMAYSFHAPNDEALNNTIFMNYKLINRSQTTLHDVYSGFFDDLDIGYYMDDYVGCDVARGSYFAYNGEAIDGSGEPQTYGDNHPVQVVTFLAGPYIDRDGRDNPAYTNDCSMLFNSEHELDYYAYNGVNFGNGIVDDERLGLCRFLSHSDAVLEPRISYEYYNRLRGLWKDGNMMVYGGSGYPGHSGTTNIMAAFMFPGNTDPCNCGTGGLDPELYWTEETAINGMPNNPGERRCTGSFGPFTFEAGGVQEIDIAFITVWKNTSQSALERMGGQIDYIREFFFNEWNKK